MENGIYLTGLWTRDSKFNEGEKYMSGYLGNAMIVVTKNKNKNFDNSPDYFLKLVQKKQKDDEDNKDSKDDLDLPF